MPPLLVQSLLYFFLEIKTNQYHDIGLHRDILLDCMQTLMRGMNEQIPNLTEILLCCVLGQEW